MYNFSKNYTLKIKIALLIQNQYAEAKKNNNNNNEKKKNIYIPIHLQPYI